jgi:glycosyltransferase involved in cell wall biosynthesis
MVEFGNRLSFVLGNYWGQCQGGAELQARYLQQEALGQGWITHYCFLSNENHIENNQETTLYPIRQKKFWSKLGNIKYPYARDVLQALKEMKPDVIYQRASSSLTGVTAYYALRHKCKFIFHVAHDKDVDTIFFPWSKPWLIPEYKFMQYGIRNADTIIAQTRFQASQLQKNYNRTAIVIPNGHPVPDDCEKPLHPITVLWIANWKPVKQPEIFVQLVKEMACNKDIRFIMIGRTDRYDALVAQAHQLNIKVMGEITNEQVNDLLDQSHILINTSQQEGFSNTFIQAWMRRVPVLSLQVDPDNTIKNNQIGYCSGTFSQLIKDTRELLTNHDLRSTMGHNARQYGIKHHSLNNINKIIEVMTR